jgi:hypothetical protein
MHVLAARVGYGLLDLAQRDGKGAVVLTKGSNWPKKQRRVAGGEVRAAGWRGARGGDRCRASLGSLTPQVDSCCSCGGATGVKRVGEPPAARNQGGEAYYRRQRQVQFRLLHRPGSWVKALGSFLASRRS